MKQLELENSHIKFRKGSMPSIYYKGLSNNINYNNYNDYCSVVWNRNKKCLLLVSLLCQYRLKKVTL